MSAPRMTQAQYDQYMKRRIAQKAAKTPAPAIPAERPSKWTETEKRYFWGVLHGVGKYEAVSLRITPPDCEEHVYTPDFVTEHIESVDLCGRTFTGPMRVCHEVKGSYRLGSQDGARLRWTFAAISHPSDVFVWAKESKRRGRWDIEVWYDGGHTRIKKRGVAGFEFNGKGGVLWRT